MPNWLTILASVFLASAILKRALLGPQPQFARAALGTLIVGYLVLGMSDQSGDAASWMGGALFFVGMMTATIMFLVDIVWMVRTGRFPWRTGSPKI